MPERGFRVTHSHDLRSRLPGRLHGVRYVWLHSWLDGEAADSSLGILKALQKIKRIPIPKEIYSSASESMSDLMSASPPAKLERVSHHRTSLEPPSCIIPATSQPNSAPSRPSRLNNQSASVRSTFTYQGLTVGTRVVRLDVRLYNLAVLHLESIPLASRSSKHSNTSIPAQVQRFRERSGRVGKESNLPCQHSTLTCFGVYNASPSNSLQSLQSGRAVRSRPSCYTILSAPSVLSCSFQSDSHKRVVDRDDEHASGLLQPRVVDVRRHMRARACAREGARHAHDVSVGGRKFLGKVDLVAGRVLVQRVYARHLVADLDQRPRRRMEAPGRGAGEGAEAEG